MSNFRNFDLLKGHNFFAIKLPRANFKVDFQQPIVSIKSMISDLAG